MGWYGSSLNFVNVPKVCLTQHIHVLCSIRGNLHQKGNLSIDRPKVKKWASWRIRGVCHVIHIYVKRQTDLSQMAKALAISLILCCLIWNFVWFTHLPVQNQTTLNSAAINSCNCYRTFSHHYIYYVKDLITSEFGYLCNWTSSEMAFLTRLLPKVIKNIIPALS